MEWRKSEVVNRLPADMDVHEVLVDRDGSIVAWLLYRVGKWYWDEVTNAEVHGPFPNKTAAKWAAQIQHEKYK